MSKPQFPEWPQELLDAMTEAGYQPCMQHGRIVMRHWRLSRYVTREFHPHNGPGRWIVVQELTNRRYRRLIFRNLADALHYFGVSEAPGEATT